MNRTASLHATVVATALLAMALSGCTMKNQQAPALTGPSELGTAIVLTATPDAINQDGASQSLITITASDPNGKPLRGLSLRSEIYFEGTRVDFGSLSARNLVTDANGRATFVYTAPSSPGGFAVDAGLTVQIVVTPVGTDFANERARITTIRLLPVGIVVPADGLVPAFTFTPAAPADHEPVFFDASTSKAGPNNGIASYSWDFGDGTRGTGRTTSHSYATPSTYQVTLTITDGLGRSAQTSQTVTVGGGVSPSADFVSSPATPHIGEVVNFSAAASRPSPGRTIRSYFWNFGDGDSKTTTSPTTTHDYQSSGTFTVTLTVTDDAGRTAVVSHSVSVASDVPDVAFSFSPASPTPGQSVAFNPTVKVVEGRTVVSYFWDFGDGTTTTQATPRHAFGSAGDYNVTLVVTDSAGKAGSKTNTVPVKSASSVRKP